MKSTDPLRMEYPHTDVAPLEFLRFPGPSAHNDSYQRAGYESSKLQEKDFIIQALSAQLAEAQCRIAELEEALRATQQQIFVHNVEKALRTATPPASSSEVPFVAATGSTAPAPGLEGTVRAAPPGLRREDESSPVLLAVPEGPSPELAASTTGAWEPAVVSVSQLVTPQLASPVATLSGCVPDLVRSAEQGKLSDVKSLLANRTDPNSQDDLGMTALHVAAKKGHAEVVSQLLEGGADPLTLSSKVKLKPLHYACKYGHVETVKALLAARADPMQPSEERGETPYMYAKNNGRIKVEELLLQALGAC
eukprot:TRINITY_DN30368_c0_g1_i1.p1 TRINITY_DN30368_c0_g1~~TRINITY_DN30368_c0_g1_i1.p1  ORF type:complete len:308 (-),score=76.08 TRINITY_DN30368_c0_g1_i1:340-1263(-)